MKKIILLSFLFALGINAVKAAPGDTTWVQANQVNLDYYNNFDDTVAFPNDGKTYRKILMVFTLGQYNCPSGTQYCHQWDYTVQNYIMTRTGDTLEMTRLMTPYATSGWPRFGASWKQPYVFDVTDFASYLKDTATVRIHYSGYSGGFTANIKFAFIEGTPDRNVIAGQKLYDFSHSYGDVNNPINDAFTTENFTAPAGTKDAQMRYLVTGHGSDNNQCCEFDSHKYFVNLNGTQIAQKEVWRDDCSMNELYPQGGTWIYHRANWCPGDYVHPIYHDLTGVTAGSNYDVNIQYENYVGNDAGNGLGSYTSSATIFYYGNFNKQLDASLDNVINPNDDPNFYRENPSNEKPTVLVHNSGATPITSIEFSYGIDGTLNGSYTWNGTLAPLASQEITLDALQDLVDLATNGASGKHDFSVKIVKVNGQMDEDATNNSFQTKFDNVPLWPSDLVMTFKTSNLATDAQGNVFIGNPHQKWVITNEYGDIVAQRANTQAATQYIDTVGMPAAGIYKLTISTENTMGLHWWPYDGQSGVVSGTFRIKGMGNTSYINMKNYKTSGTTHDDFGDEYVVYFAVKEAGTYVGLDKVANSFVSVYPNPTSDLLNIEVAKETQFPLTVKMINMMGQVVTSMQMTEAHMTIDTSNVAPGFYTVLISGENGGTTVKKIIVEK